MTLNKAKCRDLLRSADTQPQTLDYLLNELAPAWLEWEPETIWTGLKKYMGQEPNLVTKTKINAMKLLHTSEGPWEDWEAFLPVCVALSHGIPNFEVASKPSLAELFVCTKIMRGLRQIPFSEEVTRFIAACCLDEGVFFTPPPLEFLQPLLDVADYRCTRCGNIDIYDNGKCDTCGAPQSALILTPRYDWKGIKEAWDKIKGMPLEAIALDETVQGIHVHNLLNAYLTMVEAEQRHKEEVKHANS